MSFRDDRRAQSMQIGAVLLFGVLIVLLASYQAFVVPDQNREVEANHVETITGQMQDLRNAIVSVPSTHAGESITLTLGTTYPARVVAVNPDPPAGAIRTLGTEDGRVNLTVANAVATTDEVDDVWNGTGRTYDTGSLVFQPGYNEYRNAPEVVYENTLLYHRFPSGNLTRAGQRLVDGRRLTLVTLDGSLDASSSESVAVDLDAVSASSRRISLTNATDENVTLSFGSRYDAGQWRAELEADGELADQGGNVVSVTDEPIPGTDFRVVHVELAGDVTYTLLMAKVGTGTRIAAEDVAYLADVEGDGASVQEGATTRLVVEARDGLNNPVTGVTVNASVESGPQNGSLADRRVETDGDGRAVFEYEADEIDGVSSRRFRVNVSFAAEPGTDFDPDAPENASLTVVVGNTDGSGTTGSGPVSASWVSPTEDNSDGLSDCTADACTVDVGERSETDLTLRALTDPPFQNVEFNFTVDNSTVGTVESRGATSSDGEVTTVFTAEANGTTNVYFASRTGGGVMELTVENLTGSTPLPPSGSFTYTDQGSSFGVDTIEYDVDWNATDANGDLATVELFLNESDGTTLDSETIDVSDDSAGNVHTLSDNVPFGCGEEYTLTMIVTDQEGRTDTSTETDDVACN